jgi:hypothetical protein
MPLIVVQVMAVLEGLHTVGRAQLKSQEVTVSLVEGKKSLEEASIKITEFKELARLMEGATYYN